jgi:2-methylisocitrate lyase-like PEP mutase family enzyme
MRRKPAGPQVQIIGESAQCDNPQHRRNTAGEIMNSSPARRLKALINAPDILVLPGIFDGFSTRLVARAGYTAAFITGSGVSESRLGQSDVGIMGMEENVAAARAIAACSDLLLLADADTGYGNAINVIRTVREYEAAGVAAIHIADWSSRTSSSRLQRRAVQSSRSARG